MMKVEFLAEAKGELIDTIKYYNGESEGLGFEFAAEVSRTVLRIFEYPTAWTSISKRTRRCRTNRFPYGIIYQSREDMILVVAVMHLHRHPYSWRKRLPSSHR